MKGPPLPLPALPLPLSSVRGGPAQRVPLVLLCQETGISPPRPTPPHPTPTAAPRARHPHRALVRPIPSPVQGRRGGGRGKLSQIPKGTHRSVRARPPPPAPRPRSRSRLCPRCRRPALFSLGKLQAHVSPGAGQGRQWGGGGRGVARRPVDLWLT